MTPEAAAKAGLDCALAVFRKAGVPDVKFNAFGDDDVTLWCQHHFADGLPV